MREFKYHRSGTGPALYIAMVQGNAMNTGRPIFTSIAPDLEWSLSSPSNILPPLRDHHRLSSFYAAAIAFTLFAHYRLELALNCPLAL